LCLCPFVYYSNSSFRALSWLLVGAVLYSLLLPSLALPKRDIKTREEVMAFLYDQVNKINLQYFSYKSLSVRGLQRDVYLC
jgi:hypothetical protein